MKSIKLLFGALMLAGLVSAQNPTPAGEAKKPAAAAQSTYGTKAVYPLNTCVVTDEELDSDSVTVDVGGRAFKLCCQKCAAKVEKDVATYTKKLDAAIIAQQMPRYPLNTCPVSGEKLGGMGEPVSVVLDGTLVQLCCAKCSKKATAESAAMAQKVRDAAFAAQSAKYPLKTCPVTGKELGADAVSTMFGTTLVKTCCPKCVAAIEKDPAKYMAKLAPAAPAQGKDAAPGKEKKADGGKDGEDCCAAGCAGCANCATPAAGAEAKPGCCQDAKAGDKPAEAKKTEKPAEPKTDKPAPAKEPAKKVN